MRIYRLACFTTSRRVRLEAGAWGALVALNAAFVSLLLISQGAGASALAVYVSGASMFGLGAGVVGPWAASIAGSSRVAVAALVVGRASFATVPLFLVTMGDDAVPLLIAALLLWSAGEGVAQPLWIAYLTGLGDPAERNSRISDRATAAAVGAAAAMLPMLVLARLLPTDRSLVVAYLVATLAALVSTWQVAALVRLRPSASASAPPPKAEAAPDHAGFMFLGGVFAFWFGAALNRPVLPPYVVNELHAPAAYFATAAVVAAAAGAGLQPRWGSLASGRGAPALLRWSGLGAGIVPLLWTLVPDYRFGIPVEALASTCWLGHLLGLNLHAAAAAADDRQRASLIARLQLAQGSAAAIAPLAAAAVVNTVGTASILMASGIICLGATAVMTDAVRTPSALPLGRPRWRPTSVS